MVRTIGRYIETEIIQEKNQEQRQVLLKEYGNLYAHTTNELRQRHPGKTVKAYAPRLAKKTLTKRYDDLFEELMEYMTPDNIITRDDYKESLKAVMFPRIDEGTLTSRNVNNLYDELVETPRAKEFFRGRNVQRIAPENASKYSENVREKRRANYQKIVSDRREAYRVVNEEDKTVVIVYKNYVAQKGVRKEVWRDVNTGRFGLNPYKVLKKYE